MPTIICATQHSNYIYGIWNGIYMEFVYDVPQWSRIFPQESMFYSPWLGKRKSRRINFTCLRFGLPFPSLPVVCPLARTWDKNNKCLGNAFLSFPFLAVPFLFPSNSHSPLTFADSRSDLRNMLQLSAEPAGRGWWHCGWTGEMGCDRTLRGGWVGS